MPPSDMRRVEVAVRVRPAHSGVDKAGTHPSCITINEQRSSITAADTSGAYAAVAVQKHEYKEDVLFDEQSTNAEVFTRLVLDKMQRATPQSPDTLCFLAYGHTSSGKTHTIAGSESEPGILTMCVEALLQRDGVVEVSMLEVYIDRVYDLLSDSEPRKVRRRQGPHGPAVVVEDLTTCSLVSVAQWAAVSAHGMRSRRTAATERNTRSSRSHAIFTVKSRGVRLCLVDLAGSERQTVFSPQLNKESVAINKSLSRLSTVLEALSVQRVRADGSKSYVNYRDTTLTVLLQRYLSGASRTTFLACVHPSTSFFQETLSTLRYTQRLKRIKTSVVRLGGPGDVSALLPYGGTVEHEELMQELERLRARVEASDAASKALDQSHRQRIAELEDALAQREQEERTASPPNKLLEADNRVRVQRAKETRRVAGWLLSRALGDLPTINVGYDEHFDRYIPRPLQVIGYVSTMSCLPPHVDTPAGGGSAGGLAFLDVGDLSMGLSMVDAGIPPSVRLHRVPCHDPSEWEAHEWNAAGDSVYVLCFFETSDEAVDAATDTDGTSLPCCCGCVSAEALLPIATVLCVPAATPAPVKEEVLQWLIALQGEQEEAYHRGRGCTESMTSFDGSVSAYLEGSLKCEAAEQRDVPALACAGAAAIVVGNGDDEVAVLTDNATLTVSSVGGALAREVERQAADTSRLNTPFKDESTSQDSVSAPLPAPDSDASSHQSDRSGEHAGQEPSLSVGDAEERRPTVTAPHDVQVHLQENAADGPLPPPAPTAPAVCSSTSRLGDRTTKHRRKGQMDEEGRTVRFEKCQGCSVA